MLLRPEPSKFITLIAIVGVFCDKSAMVGVQVTISCIYFHSGTTSRNDLAGGIPYKKLDYKSIMSA